MIQHCITQYEENGVCYAEAWIQIDLFGKTVSLWKQKVEMVQPVKTISVEQESDDIDRTCRAGAKLTEFGIAIRKALLEKQMTQTELAREIGTSPNYLYLICTGRRQAGKYEDPIREVLGIREKLGRVS